MQVTNTPYLSHTDVVKSSNSEPKQNTSGISETAKSNRTDTVSISNQGRNAEAKWQEIADKYDMTNTTANEVMAMAQELHTNNLISASDMFDMYRPESLDFQQNLDTKRNHIENMTRDLNALKNFGNSSQESIAQGTKILEMLNRIG